ncbi:class I adenylate-forming enzyme family protein [Cryptosporangium aurantiacum]|uniref:Acyl-CoA synthetase (AMP-forming)/AMP-acid ligase II n=1 Tax=Cryptosporangium aurantiacum TaxID=134849 RepID=A0A1M7RKP7_9ACTN|nr:AMP-binding protein [Cryptosporangium aurantiacum]SHN46648.1 Acyl-CoA synthetase (AMP-forming)/AMP-acid ligase II [Cryptosporangium aurantiacum]
MATSIASAVRWWARTDGGRTALTFGADSVSYRSLNDWSSRIARTLVDRGVAPGDRVGLLGGNTPEWAATAYGVIKAGGVLVPLNPRLVAAELHKLFTDSGLTLVVTDAAHNGTLDEVGLPVPRIGLDEITALRTGGTDDFQIDRAPDEPVAILFTSGSTGLSKGVVCTNRTLLDIVFEASLTQDGLRPGGSSLLLLPLCFTPGLVWGLVMSTVLGGTLFVEAELNPSRAVRIIAEHRIGTLFGVPLIWEALAAAPEFTDADLSSLRTAVVGGAAVSVPLLQAWAAKGVALRQIYGMTEAGGIATATLTSEAADHPGSCGSGSIFTELKVVRADGTEAAPGEQGEVLLRGPGVTPGYWNDPETTARALRDGWLHSGDLGVRDEAGRLTFVDRLKDLIISGGINISPVEIEAVISGIPGVAEVAVIAAKDDRFGETPAAIVSGSVDAGTVVAACDKAMADYKVPRYVVVRPEPLPRLASGKLSKRAIRDEYADVNERFEKVR